MFPSSKEKLVHLLFKPRHELLRPSSQEDSRSSRSVARGRSGSRTTRSRSPDGEWVDVKAEDSAEGWHGPLTHHSRARSPLSTHPAPDSDWEHVTGQSAIEATFSTGPHGFQQIYHLCITTTSNFGEYAKEELTKLAFNAADRHLAERLSKEVHSKTSSWSEPQWNTHDRERVCQGVARFFWLLELEYINSLVYNEAERKEWRRYSFKAADLEALRACEGSPWYHLFYIKQYTFYPVQMDVHGRFLEDTTLLEYITATCFPDKEEPASIFVYSSSSKGITKHSTEGPNLLTEIQKVDPSTDKLPGHITNAWYFALEPLLSKPSTVSYHKKEATAKYSETTAESVSRLLNNYKEDQWLAQSVDIVIHYFTYVQPFVQVQEDGDAYCDAHNLERLPPDWIQKIDKVEDETQSKFWAYQTTQIRRSECRTYWNFLIRASLPLAKIL